MRLFDGVLLDWSGTLVHDPEPADRVRWALQIVNRPSPDAVVTALVDRLDQASQRPEVVEALHDQDCSPQRHRSGELLWYAAAGLDAELAEQLYDFDAYAENRPLYPDVLDVLRRLRTCGLRLVVLSDIHLDLRPLLAQHGAADLIDGYALSCEHGVQKPDPRLFLVGLGMLGTTPQRTLMVGDLATKDGGAAEVGITALILPRDQAHPDRPRLGALDRLVAPVATQPAQ